MVQAGREGGRVLGRAAARRWSCWLGGAARPAVREAAPSGGRVRTRGQGCVPQPQRLEPDLRPAPRRVSGWGAKGCFARRWPVHRGWSERLVRNRSTRRAVDCDVVGRTGCGDAGGSEVVRLQGPDGVPRPVDGSPGGPLDGMRHFLGASQPASHFPVLLSNRDPQATDSQPSRIHHSRIRRECAIGPWRTPAPVCRSPRLRTACPWHPSPSGAAVEASQGCPTVRSFLLCPAEGG